MGHHAFSRHLQTYETLLSPDSSPHETTRLRDKAYNAIKHPPLANSERLRRGATITASGLIKCAPLDCQASAGFILGFECQKASTTRKVEELRICLCATCTRLIRRVLYMKEGVAGRPAGTYHHRHVHRRKRDGRGFRRRGEDRS